MASNGSYGRKSKSDPMAHLHWALLRLFGCLLHYCGQFQPIGQQRDKSVTAACVA
jgi:hypothetical protein